MVVKDATDRLEHIDLHVKVIQVALEFAGITAGGTGFLDLALENITLTA